MIRLMMVLLALPAASLAQDTPARGDILSCVAAMETDADWAVCRTRMFAGCADHPAGSSPHVACLTDDRAGWQEVLDGTTTDVTGILTAEGATELAQLLTQWFGYVGQKCAAVGASRAEISEEAAILGCEISEIVGLTAELQSCRAGSSTSPYCIRKE